MPIFFTEFLKYDDKDIYLTCKGVEGILEGMNFDIIIQDRESFELKMCRIEEGRWINVTQNLPEWVHDITSSIMNVLEETIQEKKDNLKTSI